MNPSETPQKPMISIVAPVYNEGEGIHKFYERVRDTMDRIGEPWELVMVNDGSRDNSLEQMRLIHERDPRVRDPNGDYRTVYQHEHTTVSELAAKLKPFKSSEVRASLVRAGCAAAERPRTPIPTSWLHGPAGVAWWSEIKRRADAAAARTGGKFSRWSGSPARP